MNISEILLDRLNETKLFEMAYERKHAKNTVTGISPQLFDHLLKLFVFESPDSINHWKQEINGFINTINKIYLKPKNIKPDSLTLYRWIIEESAPYYSVEYITNTIKILKRQKYQHVKIREHDPEWVLNKIKSIINLICKDVATNKFETIEDYL